MSPNQPKTPISSFRLSKEVRADLARISETMGTTMTGAIGNLTASFVAVGKALRKDAGRYPFDAYTAGLGAFRESMDYQPGDVIPQDVASMVDNVIRAANPIIREAQHDETLGEVVRQLEELGADAELVEHFRQQASQG